MHALPPPRKQRKLSGNKKRQNDQCAEIQVLASAIIKKMPTAHQRTRKICEMAKATAALSSFLDTYTSIGEKESYDLVLCSIDAVVIGLSYHLELIPHAALSCIDNANHGDDLMTVRQLNMWYKMLDNMAQCIWKSVFQSGMSLVERRSSKEASETQTVLCKGVVRCMNMLPSFPYKDAADSRWWKQVVERVCCVLMEVLQKTLITHSFRDPIWVDTFAFALERCARNHFSERTTKVGSSVFYEISRGTRLLDTATSATKIKQDQSYKEQDGSAIEIGLSRSFLTLEEALSWLRLRLKKCNCSDIVDTLALILDDEVSLHNILYAICQLVTDQPVAQLETMDGFVLMKFVAHATLGLRFSTRIDQLFQSNFEALLCVLQVRRCVSRVVRNSCIMTVISFGLSRQRPTYVRQRAASVVWQLSTFVENRSILAKQPGMLTAMIAFAKDQSTQQGQVDFDDGTPDTSFSRASWKKRILALVAAAP